MLAVGILVVTASPALAHGPGSAGPPNWVSTVTSEPTDGLAWSVVGVDAALRLVNTSDADVVVLGYSGEPYLRVGPAGVFENRRSLATWLNRDRFADLTGVEVPADVIGGERAPTWVKVSDGSAWTWFDHRIHWMNPRRLPPEVAAEPNEPRVVQTWEVPAERAGRHVGPSGTLAWHPVPLGGAGPWLWPVVAAVALAGLVLPVRRREYSAQAVAGLLVAVALAGAWHEVGTLLGLGPVVPQGAFPGAVIRSCLLVLVTLGALALARRRGRWWPWLLVGAAVTVAVVVGARELDVLRAPVPPGPLPAPATRALVAVAIACPVAALSALGVAAARTPAMSVRAGPS